MSFKDTQSYKEIRSDWRWIHSMDPDAAAEALQELTELQRQVIFRNVVNGESTESIAQDMGCTSRNVRDIRNRALKTLRTKITKHEGTGYVGEHPWIAFPALLVVGLLLLLFLQLDFTIPEWVQYIAVAVAAPPVLWVLWRGRNREVEDLLQRHWAYMNGSRKKK